MRSEEYTYKLYADIIPVKGYSRSILLDVTKKNYWYITNELFDILNEEINFEDLERKYSNDIKILYQYKKFLLKNDLIFPISQDETDHFPRINLKWYTPSQITNMLIDVDHKTSISSLSKITDEIGNLGVEAVLFRCFSSQKIHQLKNIIFHWADSENNKLRDIQVEISMHEKEHIESFWSDLKEISNLSIISSITIYMQDKNLTNIPPEDKKINFIQKYIHNQKSCGTIQGNIDSVNLEVISESIHHNSCLNCKLSVDTLGNIKNCPSMSQNFGNIKNTTLEEALNHHDFKKYWNLTKDKIEVCKDCEFRYICTDCRAYTERSHKNKE
ncbi:grasp-with-spasm system SPASM domain peptide maturase, partial [uncultured Chryseobacterium sp.]|uniref:grasp-with-spasm system SPASM domain peptide maturase n=1 Tax=uncultured Chryseobacterium sp. TaxID=259322 RepID=UPI00262D3D33